MIEVVTDLLREATTEMKSRPIDARTESWAERSSGSLVAITGVPNFRLMATM